jgi:hypothetical protein
MAPREQPVINIADFFRFCSMFGPAETAMLKIHALLEVATAQNHWLYFGLFPSSEYRIYGGFDDQESNALIIHHGMKELNRVWNLSLVSFGGDFVTDTHNRTYGSWEPFFG